jgi:hypothetical protein
MAHQHIVPGVADHHIGKIVACGVEIAAAGQ